MTIRKEPEREEGRREPMACAASVLYLLGIWWDGGATIRSGSPTTCALNTPPSPTVSHPSWRLSCTCHARRLSSRRAPPKLTKQVPFASFPQLLPNCSVSHCPLRYHNIEIVPRKPSFTFSKPLPQPCTEPDCTCSQTNKLPIFPKSTLDQKPEKYDARNTMGEDGNQDECLPAPVYLPRARTPKS